ncbi:MAG: phosphonate metabolism transcriptional regulator PhnF [Pseudomonadota bacterium]|nr:phosphonate metabolism transcriptional regulator PhnF [Pseudomonadota bacterium]
MERVSGTALWRQIETALEKDIADRVWAPGEKLPTEADFAQRFGVNRHTVRRALSELQERGLIRIEQGRGMFVQESVVDYPLTRRTRFTETISAQSRVPGHKLHKAYLMPADREVADALGIIRGREVLCLETIGLVDERPLIFGRHHFPCPRFRGLEDMFVKTGSITTSLKRFGVADYFRRRTAIMAVLPTPEEAVILQQPRMRPVLRYEALNTDETGEPVEFTVGLFAGDRAQLLVEDWG